MEAALKKCRTCETCRALDWSHYGFRCLLGYAQCSEFATPLEPCPKPRTVKDYARAKRKDARP